MHGSAQTIMFNPATAATMAFLPVATWSLPSNFYIVVDSLTYSLVSDTQSNYGIQVLGGDGAFVAWMERQLGDSERDIMHMTFPKGLIIQKLTYSPAAGQVAGARTNAVYDGVTALIQVTGTTPASGMVVCNYRIVPVVELGD